MKERRICSLEFSPTTRRLVWSVAEVLKWSGEFVHSILPPQHSKGEFVHSIVATTGTPVDATQTGNGKEMAQDQRVKALQDSSEYIHQFSLTSEKI